MKKLLFVLSLALGCASIPSPQSVLGQPPLPPEMLQRRPGQPTYDQLLAMVNAQQVAIQNLMSLVDRLPPDEIGIEAQPSYDQLVTLTRTQTAALKALDERVKKLEQRVESPDRGGGP
jgi:hypothetical protein